MNTYTITQGNIAAMVYVDAPNGTRYDCIYMCDRKPIEAYKNSNMARDVAHELPLAVRAAVSRDFGVTFSLPVERREGHIRSCVPYTVTAD